MPTLQNIDGRSLVADLNRTFGNIEQAGNRRRADKKEQENIRLAELARGIGGSAGGIQQTSGIPDPQRGQGIFPSDMQREKSGGFLSKIAPGLSDALGKLNQTREPEAVDQMRDQAEQGRATADLILKTKSPTEKRAIILKRADEVRKAGGDNLELLKAAGGSPAQMDLQAQKAQMTSNATLDVLPAPTDAERLRARAALSVRDPNALVAIQRDEAVQRQIEARKRAERRAAASARIAAKAPKTELGRKIAAIRADISNKNIDADRGQRQIEALQSELDVSLNAGGKAQRILDLENDLQDELDGVLPVDQSDEGDPVGEQISATPKPSETQTPADPNLVNPAFNALLGENPDRPQADVLADFMMESAREDDTREDLSGIDGSASQPGPQEIISTEELAQPLPDPQRGGPSMNAKDALQDVLKAQTFVSRAKTEEEKTAAQNVFDNAVKRREILLEVGKFTGQTDIGKLIADQAAIVNQFGENSPQALAINELIGSMESGEKPNLKDVSTFRKEFTALSKDFITMSNAVKKVNTSLDTGAGDVALIFNYMKILDPNSVVRETEFATAENTAGIPTRVMKAYNKALTGERLTNEMRDNFKEAANILFQGAADTQINWENQYSKIAERQNFDPRNVVVDFVPSAYRPPPEDFPKSRDIWKALSEDDRELWLP